MAEPNDIQYDEIPPMTFYGNLKKIARTVTLEEAEAAVSAIPDSDIEEQIEDYEAPDSSSEKDESEYEKDDNIPLAELAVSKIKFVSDIGMSRNRFESLRNNLHIIDVNAEYDKSDKLWKVRPLISSFESRCEQLDLEENLCIDESMIPFNGQLVVKQYIQGKPNPWGVKVFMLCGSSDILYRSILYQGSTTVSIDIQEKYAATDGLVTYLSYIIPDHHGHKLFCDNYFTSVLLLRELLQRGIFMAGTIRNNRLKKCQLKMERQLQKLGRGSCDSLVTSDNEVVAVHWYDNKVVNMASNFIGIEPEDEVKRCDKKQGVYIMVQRQAIIRLYNMSMGGVDKSDFLIALYRTFIRSRKWTLRVIFHYFNLAVCNAWLEYRRDIVQRNQQFHLDLLQFTMIIAESLAFSGIPTNTPKRGRPQSSTPSPRSSPVPKRDKKIHVGPPEQRWPNSQTNNYKTEEENDNLAIC